MSAIRLLVLTVLALVAFAANSVLGRMALGPELIDPASYTSLRVASGALALWLIVFLAGRRPDTGRAAVGGHGDWTSAAMLFLYAIAFSYAYIWLDTGIGALILFALVQLTMIGTGLARGERPHPWQWIGLAVALTGLVWLLAPGLTAPPLGAAMLMGLAGVAWGVYSLRGRGARNPVAVTADNFLRAVPLALAVTLVTLPGLDVSVPGAALAVTSGALTSGVGYAIWYAALPWLSATRAATVQFAAPVLAAVAGVLLMAEPVTLRLVGGGALILGGVALTVLVRERVRAV